MDKDKLVELVERCEAATGSDDATDWAIAEAVGCAPGLSYTASLDAAMTLVSDRALMPVWRGMLAAALRSHAPK